MSRTTWGIFLIVAAFLILGFIAYQNNSQRRLPIVFSVQDELQSLWNQYKSDNLEANTHRVLDKQNNNITTSEGESYAMLRAVWLGDKTTFDQSWTWTQSNLQHSNDHLFSWKFGARPDGTYGVLTDQGGQNTASDADSDIALSLVFAASRWNDQKYLDSAKLILNDMWTNEVITVKGMPYLAADNLEKNSNTTILINPSYLSPYAYRIFAKIDPTHPWMQLVDSSYSIIGQSMSASLGTQQSANIPPDWIFIDRTTGMISAPVPNSNQRTNMGFDAMRVPFRLTLDWQWNKEPRAQKLLSNMTFLNNEWNTNGLLYETYSHTGNPVEKSESAAFYAGTLGYFIVTNPSNAQTIYNNKLQILVNPDSDTWKDNLGYYDSNWAWFGIALYNNLLPNLAAS